MKKKFIIMLIILSNLYGVKKIKIYKSIKFNFFCEQKDVINKCKDSLFVKKDISLIEKLLDKEEIELSSRKLTHYDSLKWGNNPSIPIYYESTLRKKDYILYKTIVDEYDSKNIPYQFKKINSDSLIIYNNSFGFIPLSTYKIMKFSLKEDKLLLENNKSIQVLFDKKRRNNGISNMIGKYFYKKTYSHIEFFGKVYSNISEFYLITNNKKGTEEFLIWFNNNYDIIRIESINSDVGKGFIIQ